MIKYLMMPVVLLTACSSNLVITENEIFNLKYEVALPVRSNDIERVAIGFNMFKDNNTVLLKVGYISENTGIIKSIAFNVDGQYYLFKSKTVNDNEYVSCNEIGICTTVTTPHAEIEITKDFLGELRESKRSLIILNMNDGQTKVAILKSPQFNSNAFNLLMKI